MKNKESSTNESKRAFEFLILWMKKHGSKRYVDFVISR